MFDDIISGFTKVATPQRILILIIFVVLAWLLLSYSDSKGLMMDPMETGTSAAPADAGASLPDAPAVAASSGRSITNPSDLLPADANSQWASLNPTSMNQNDILAADMLQAGYHVGLDTIGQSMRNANLQLRSDPPIPKQNVGPWNQSTYEPDISRLPLEIGSGAASA